MFNTKQEKLKYFVEHESKASFSQSPRKWFIENGYADCVDLISENTAQTRQNILLYVYGPGICKNCNTEHTRQIGWKRKWTYTCSYECECELHSKRQQGDKNTSHRMTEETKNVMKLKMSNIIRAKIKDGTFTPNTNNYRTHEMIRFIMNGTPRKVRSLWELIYWLNNEDLEYETIRLEYFDSTTSKNKIYITDFFDRQNNTIIEIKPKAYQNVNFHDKKMAVMLNGYNFICVDEDYFNNCKTPEMIERIRSVVVNFSNIEKRLKWLRKAR